MPPEKRGEEMNGSRFRPASTPGYGTWSENPSTISQSAHVTLVTPDVTLRENGSLVRRALPFASVGETGQKSPHPRLTRPHFIRDATVWT
jgi:hypothetical protein